jgi:hypothetical protein
VCRFYCVSYFGFDTVYKASSDFFNGNFDIESDVEWVGHPPILLSTVTGSKF